MRLNAGSPKYSIPPILWCILLCALACQPALAGDVALQWDPNPENDLAGYKFLSICDQGHRSAGPPRMMLCPVAAGHTCVFLLQECA
jgi:hypothetical protein